MFQKMSHEIYYIGAFPPPYGGVTVKNKNLYHELCKHLTIRGIDLIRIKRGDLKEILRCVWAMLTGRQYVVAVSSRANRRTFTRILYWLKRNVMRRSVLIVMGGVVDDVIDAGANFLQMLNTYRKVYVELPEMQEKLEAAGVCNVAIYPNGRPRPDALPDPTVDNKPLNCVFFSTVQPEKGVDLILQAAHMLPQMQFHFYGEISQYYQQEFNAAIQLTDNAVYHGVFTGGADAVYRELGQYDVILLPTRWGTEGIPGILIEAKIASVPAIVSRNVKKEIVRHDYDGIVMQDITESELISALEELDKNREKLLEMKFSAKASAEKFYIDVCAQNIISCIQER